MVCSSVSRGLAVAAFSWVAVIACYSQSSQEPTSSKPSEVRKIVQVDSSITLIQEKSLSLYSNLQASQNTGQSRRTFWKSGVPGEMANRDNDGRGLSDLQSELPNGATYYVFQLQSKEILKITLNCETAGMVWLQFVKPQVNDGMASAFRRANLPPRNLRSKKIEISNILDKPYEVVLALYGMVNYPYTLNIERKL